MNELQIEKKEEVNVDIHKDKKEEVGPIMGLFAV